MTLGRLCMRFGVAGGIAAAAAFSGVCFAKVKPDSDVRKVGMQKYPFETAPLPYPYDALQGAGISKETLTYHHDFHHNAYVTKLNGLVKENNDLQKSTLEDIIRTQKGGLFNNAAQAWNHTFYFQCLSPNPQQPSDQLKSRIEKKWGTFDAFKKAFNDKGAGHFGSGWVWLVQSKSGDLDIVDTHDAGCPISEGQVPLLTCDVWEHAYYIDYRNNRAKYLESFWQVADWSFANDNTR